MVKKVLPPLNEQNQIPNIATSGEWKVEDSSFLEKLGKGLKVGGEDLISASDIVFCTARNLTSTDTYSVLTEMVIYE